MSAHNTREFPTHSRISLTSKSYPRSPWNKRTIVHEQEKRFLALGMLHELTLKWIEFLNIKHPPYLPPYPTGQAILSVAAENLWMLESIAGSKPDSFQLFLDDTSTDDILGRLDHAVWIAQAYTLQHILEKDAGSERDVLRTTLEQAAWRLGRRTAEERSSSFSVAGRNDLPSLVLSCTDTPFLGHGTAKAFSPAQYAGFLVKRVIRTEMLLELQLCPHRHTYPEVRKVADPLCRIHSHWLRGYAYGLNPRVAMEMKTAESGKGGRCEQRWYFITNPTS